MNYLLELPETLDYDEMVKWVAKTTPNAIGNDEMMGLLFSITNLLRKVITGNAEQVAYLTGEARYAMSEGYSLTDYADELHNGEGSGLEGESIRYTYSILHH